MEEVVESFTIEIIREIIVLSIYIIIFNIFFEIN